MAKIIETGDGMSLARIVSKICDKAIDDMTSIMQDDSSISPATFLKRAFSDSSSRSVYYAGRNPNDGFPPRNNSLRNKNMFETSSEKRSFQGVSTSLWISEKGNHRSLWGETKGQHVYPWIWIDEGTTYQNRFTGNPRNIAKNFVRDWHTQGYRNIFINKMGSQLRRRGWEIDR